jgi:hypothetical protein
LARYQLVFSATDAAQASELRGISSELVFKLQRHGGLQGEKKRLFRCDIPHIGHLSIIFLVDHERAMSSLHMWNGSVKIICNPLGMAARDARLHGARDRPVES